MAISLEKRGCRRRTCSVTRQNTCLKRLAFVTDCESGSQLQAHPTLGSISCTTDGKWTDVEKHRHLIGLAIAWTGMEVLTTHSATGARRHTTTTFPMRFAPCVAYGR